MPVKFGRLGLGESPWERVRERGFEWGSSGSARAEAKDRKAEAQKGWVRKSRAPLPQPVILAQYNQPESGTPPSHQ